MTFSFDHDPVTLVLKRDTKCVTHSPNFGRDYWKCSGKWGWGKEVACCTCQGVQQQPLVCRVF